MDDWRIKMIGKKKTTGNRDDWRVNIIGLVIIGTRNDWKVIIVGIL